MGSGQVGWPPGTGLGECVSSPVAPSYPPRHCCISSARGTVGAHHPSAEGKHLSVSTPHPQQVPVFPDAGTISLATPLMTRGRRLGLSVSKFMCLKKKKSHSGFLYRSRFYSQFCSTIGRTAGLGNGLSSRAQNGPGPVGDSCVTRHPTESSYRGSSALFWDIEYFKHI